MINTRKLHQRRCSYPRDGRPKSIYMGGWWWMMSWCSYPKMAAVKGHWKHPFWLVKHGETIFSCGVSLKRSQRIHAYARFHTCCNPDLPSDTAVRFTSSVRVGFPTWLVQESFGSDIRSDLNSNPQNADVYGPHTAFPLILFQGAECNGLDGLQNETHWTTMNLVRRCHKCTENCSCL